VLFVERVFPGPGQQVVTDNTRILKGSLNGVTQMERAQGQFVVEILHEPRLQVVYPIPGADIIKYRHNLIVGSQYRHSRGLASGEPVQKCLMEANSIIVKAGLSPTLAMKTIE
jgi:hypothetical protein